MPEWKHCKVCNKKLAVIEDDGTIKFVFGQKIRGGQLLEVVDIEIKGEVVMRCLNINCRFKNTFNSSCRDGKFNAVKP